MSKALYRKYRPQTFDGVIGQEHIVETLKNQIRAGRVGHAYLFCGSRGVGKTSLARIFSRAINCTGSGTLPCGKCSSCQSAQSETGLDIIEIDAASNNGVDDARGLREQVKYPPVLGKYKVYIIDEVHMLTQSAFNALLKTLEEPPDHVVFILATTEPQKLPATILSRCLRFDFKLVPSTHLYSLISKIYDAEGKEFEEDALRAVAASAEGSVRDALSLADMFIDLSAGKLRAKEVADILGINDELICDLLVKINACDIKGALLRLSEIALSGKSMTLTAKELALCARDLMAAKIVPEVLDTTLTRKQKLIEAGESFTVSFLAAMTTLFAELDYPIKVSVSPKIAMEAALIRACKLCALDLNAIDQRLVRLENGGGGVVGGGVGGAGVGGVAGSVVAEAVTPKNTGNSQGDKRISKDIPPQEDNSLLPPPEVLSNNLPPNNADLANQYSRNNLSPNNSQSNNADLANRHNQANPAPNNSAPNNSAQNNADLANQCDQNAPSPQNKSLSPVQLWGRLITFFRKNSTPAFFQIIGRQNPLKVSLKEGVLTVLASRENFLALCDGALQEELKRALLSEGCYCKISVEKDMGDVDMEKEVEQLIGDFGKEKITINS